MSEEGIGRILANIFDVDISQQEFTKKFSIVCMKRLKKKLGSDFRVVQRPAKSVSANSIGTILKEYKIKKEFRSDVVCVIIWV